MRGSLYNKFVIKISETVVRFTNYTCRGITYVKVNPNQYRLIKTSWYLEIYTRHMYFYPS